jgi:hypothetical protein
MEIMKISLKAIASSKTTQMSVNGEIVTVDGVEFDLSVIPNGGQVEGELPALGLIKRVAGVIELTVLYHYDSELAELNQSTNEADYIVEVISGEVPSPIAWLPMPTEIEAAAEPEEV